MPLKLAILPQLGSAGRCNVVRSEKEREVGCKNAAHDDDEGHALPRLRLLLLLGL